jgi:hypothetical protein
MKRLITAITKISNAIAASKPLVFPLEAAFTKRLPMPNKSWAFAADGAYACKASATITIFHPAANAKIDPVTSGGKSAGIVIFVKRAQRDSPNTWPTALTSFGITFKPPIVLKTMLQIIEKNSINIAAPSRKFDLTKNRIITGKNAITGTDSSTSYIGSKKLSTLRLLSAITPKGTPISMESTYAMNNRKSDEPSAIRSTPKCVVYDSGNNRAPVARNVASNKRKIGRKICVSSVCMKEMGCFLRP